MHAAADSMAILGLLLGGTAHCQDPSPLPVLSVLALLYQLCLLCFGVGRLRMSYAPFQYRMRGGDRKLMFYSSLPRAARPCPRVTPSLLKLLRLHRLKRMIKSLYRKFPSMELVITGLELLVTMTLVAHWMACLWYVQDAARHALFCFTTMYWLVSALHQGWMRLRDELRVETGT